MYLASARARERPCDKLSTALRRAPHATRRLAACIFWGATGATVKITREHTFSNWIYSVANPPSNDIRDAGRTYRLLTVTPYFTLIARDYSKAWQAAILIGGL